MRVTPPPPPKEPSPLELLANEVKELKRMLQHVRDDPYGRPKHKGTVYLYLSGLFPRPRAQESKRLYTVLGKYANVNSIFLECDEMRTCVGHAWCRVADERDVDYILDRAQEIYEKSGIIVKPCSSTAIPDKAYRTICRGRKY